MNCLRIRLNKVTDKKDHKIIKFNVIIGNPPYQASKKQNSKTDMCGKKIWNLFFELSIKYCKDNGYISLIHPGQWRKPGHYLFKIFKQYNLKYLKIQDVQKGLKYFNAWTGYDWYLLQKSKYQNKTEVNSNNKKQILDLREWDFLPNSDFKIISNLIATDEKDRLDVIHSRSAYGSDRKWINTEKTDIFKFPCIYGITRQTGIKLLYSSTDKNGHFGIPKIIIPLSRYTDAIIDDTGKYGVCQFAFAIKIKNKNEGDCIKKIILSNEFKKIWKAFEWTYNSKNWQGFQYLKKDFWEYF